MDWYKQPPITRPTETDDQVSNVKFIIGTKLLIKQIIQKVGL